MRTGARARGVWLMLAASVCFSLMSVLVKALSARIPTAEIVLARTALPLPLLVWLVHRRGIPLVARNRGWMLGRAVAGTVAIALNYWALARLPLADVSLLGKLQPVLIALLAPALIGERPSRLVVVCLLASLAGSALVLQPSLRVGNAAGLAVLVSALASALALMSVRRLSADDHPTVIVLDFTAFTALLSAAATLGVFVMPTPAEAAGLCAMSALATAGQLLVTHAYAIEEAPVVSAVSYTAVGFAVLWGWLFWDERPGRLVWAGGSLVVAAGVLLLWSRRGGGARPYRGA